MVENVLAGEVNPESKDESGTAAFDQAKLLGPVHCGGTPYRTG